MAKDSIYCVKCRDKRIVEVVSKLITWKDSESGEVRSRNGIEGICPKCGTKMKKFVKGGDAAAIAVAESVTVPGVAPADEKPI